MPSVRARVRDVICESAKECREMKNLINEAENEEVELKMAFRFLKRGSHLQTQASEAKVDRVLGVLDKAADILTYRKAKVNRVLDVKLTEIEEYLATRWRLKIGQSGSLRCVSRHLMT